MVIFNYGYNQVPKDKKYQAGISATMGINSQKMGTNYVDANRNGSDLGIGINVNILIKDAYAIATGAEFDFEKLYYETKTPTFYRFDDTKILKISESDTTNQVFTLVARKEEPIYLTIPSMILFQTDFIGYFRYYAKFGLKNSFLLNNRIEDSGYLGTSAAKNMNMKSRGDLFFYKGAIGLAAGTQWNFIGSTCLMAEVGYYYGFTPLHLTNKERNMTLYTVDENSDKKPFSMKATQRQLMVKIAVLF